jgi:hypothetical protein
MVSSVICYAHQLKVITREVSSTYFSALYFLNVFPGSVDFSKLSKKLNEFDKSILDTSVQFSHLHQITTQRGHLQWLQAEKKSYYFFQISADWQKNEIMKRVLLLTILINEKNQFKTAFTWCLEIPYILFMKSEYLKMTYNFIISCM